jgi:hypothetical protein
VGFYGGINYGFGYFGVGFVGGRWDGGHFFYNRAVANINIENIHNVYEDRVNVTVNHTSFNGGPGGIDARPTPQDEAAERGRHVGPVAAQNQHMQAARGNPEMRASANHGKPPIAATARPGEFSGHGVTAAREAGGDYHPPADRAQTDRGGAHPEAGAPNHASDLKAPERITPNTGDAGRDRKIAQQQEKLQAKQEKERQKLEKQQENEHKQAAKQHYSDTQKQVMEQRHQQQTQQLQQRHTEQQQNLQRQAQPARGGKR